MKEMKNKKLVGIALVLCLVLAGGALTALVSTIGGSSGGRLMLPEVEHECVFSLSTGTVSAAEDPDGKGYEYFACAECGEMRKIAGNHESGHYFRTLSNGKKMCACGALLVRHQEDAVLKNEFTYGTAIADYDLNLSYLSDGFIENDMWEVSRINGQAALYASSNPDFMSILKGAYNGDVVSELNFSFDILYTGNFTAKGVFLNWQMGFPFELLFDNDGNGKMLAYKSYNKSNAILLNPDVLYTFTLNYNYSTERMLMTVKGADLNEVVLFEVNQPLTTTFTMIGISRNAFFCSDGTYSLYMDNMTVGYVGLTLNESQVNTTNLCDHNFAVKGVVDYDHPASEKWKKYTCKDCGCWYYGR